MQTRGTLATSHEGDYPRTIMQWIESRPQRPHTAAAEYRSLRHANWQQCVDGGVATFILGPRTQVRPSTVHTNRLRQRGSRWQHRTTLDMSHPDGGQSHAPMRSINDLFYSGSRVLQPAGRSSPSYPRHHSQLHEPATAPVYLNTTYTTEYKPKFQDPYNRIRLVSMENSLNMTAGQNMRETLVHQPCNHVTQFRSQYSDIHNKLGNKILSIEPVKSKPQTPSVTSFRRTSGNRILNQSRTMEASIIN